MDAEAQSTSDHSNSTYKWCFVPECNNSSLNARSKLFLAVPRMRAVRRQWARLARREDANTLTSSNPWYCCEDHFNLEEDVENYIRFRMIGGRLLLKKGVLPHKFECQGKKAHHARRKRAAASKRDHHRNLQEALASDHSSAEEDLHQQPTCDAEMAVDTQADAGTASRVVGVQVKPSFQETGTQTDVLTQNAGVQTDGCVHDVSLESESSCSDDENAESDASYEPDHDDDSEGDDIPGPECSVDNAAYLARMRHLCKTNPKDYMGLNEEGLCVLELISGKITGICTKQSQSKLTAFDACCMVLVKIKQDRSFQMIADDFGISRSYAGRIFRIVLPQIAAYAKAFVFWPSQVNIRANLPLAFKARFSSVTAIIDCLEIEIEKPESALKQAQTWSSYKSCNTVKYLVSIVPSGMVNFVSGGFGGRTSDMEVLHKSGFLSHMEPGMVVMADRGFKGIEPVLRSMGCSLIRPDSVGAHDIPEAGRVLFSKQVASLRIHVERVIRRMREFAMVRPHAVVQSVLVSQLDRIMNVVCGFVNLQHDLTKV